MPQIGCSRSLLIRKNAGVGCIGMDPANAFRSWRQTAENFTIFKVYDLTLSPPSHSRINEFDARST
jgi:hypothetical protein